MNWKPIKDYRYIVIHCSATGPHQDFTIEDIRRWHRERGFFDVGYHFVIRRDGVVEPGRPLDRPGAHAVGFNEVSLGVCLVGGVNRQGQPDYNFTTQQMVELASLVRSLTKAYPQAEVLGHRDLPNVRKACPSFDVRGWWAAVK